MKQLLSFVILLISTAVYSATPSYSNFSSNQFAPSATYTVTVKNKPLLTNMFEYGALSFTNAQFATVSTISNSATNMTFDAPFGQRRQYIFQTSGTPVMVMSNGFVGVGTSFPQHRMDLLDNSSLLGVLRMENNSISGYSAANVYDSSGTIKAGFGYGNANVGSVALRSSGYFWTDAGVDFVVDGGNKNPAGIIVSGTNGIKFNTDTGTYLQYSFQTSGTPVMVISNGMVGIGKSNPANALDVLNPGKISTCFLGTFFTCDGTIACGNILGRGFLFCGGSESSNRPGIFSMAFNTNIILISDSRRSLNDQPISGAALAFDSIYQDPSPYESATNTLVYSRSNALYVSDPTYAPGSIIQQNASAFMTPATITNLLNVTAGKTNGIFVNTNGPLVYIWSDGFNIYSKTIAP